jgi:signal peptidase I
VAVALALIIQASIAKPYEIPTESMYPTIKANDRIIANRLIYRFRDIGRGDVIVFEPTMSAKQTCGDVVSDVPFVKRVVGLPGDRVEVRNGLTLVNGVSFVVKNAARPVYTKVFPPVPKGKLLVLGDNRNASCDSHQWSDPFVPEDNVIGQAEVTYWPLENLKFL